MIKGIIFDFDGLVVDTETIWFQAFQEAVHRYGMNLTLEQFARVIGTHDAELYSLIERSITKPATLEQIKKEAHELFHLKMGEPVLRDGVKEYLEAATALGLHIGLASSSSRNWIEGYLNKLGIIDYFQVIKTKEDVKYVKPDPELYIQAHTALGIEPHESIAFEDSLNGLIAARKAGLHCVIVPNSVTMNLPFEDFSHRISSMSESKLEDVMQKVIEASVHKG
ncbi:HAD family hydrolase [Ectobacillus panaciterrae]|uniref:HAD family hydrolase n=1 Tax=Ectobacillus panaciterrae TaxID=363872 RepID=UPI00041D2697|nr:HAD family hydrolase [Ectobacillus panaciterrae]